MQDARTIEDNVKGAALSKEAQRAQAVAALRREEAVLAQQASDIASQVRLWQCADYALCYLCFSGCTHVIVSSW
jgi:hypothetical protein